MLEVVPTASGAVVRPQTHDQLRVVVESNILFKVHFIGYVHKSKNRGVL